MKNSCAGSDRQFHAIVSGARVDDDHFIDTAIESFKTARKEVRFVPND
jgi:hypothetical protein